METNTERDQEPPASYPKFEVKGSWDFPGSLKDFKIRIPEVSDFIGELPPSLSTDEPERPGGTFQMTVHLVSGF
jgi:hypothetical protein